VLDGDPGPPEKGHSPPFSAHVYCGQTAGWIKMPLGTEVDLGPGHIVLDENPAPPERGTAPPPFFGPCLLWPNGRPSQLLLSSCLNVRNENCSAVYVLQCTSGKLVAGKTTTVKVAQCASTSSAHARPDIGLSPATPNVPKSEVGTVLSVAPRHYISRES